MKNLFIFILFAIAIYWSQVKCEEKGECWKNLVALNGTQCPISYTKGDSSGSKTCWQNCPKAYSYACNLYCSSDGVTCSLKTAEIKKKVSTELGNGYAGLVKQNTNGLLPEAYKKIIKAVNGRMCPL